MLVLFIGVCGSTFICDPADQHTHIRRPPRKHLDTRTHSQTMAANILGMCVLIYYHFHSNLEQVITHAAAAASSKHTILYWPFRNFVLQSDRERHTNDGLTEPGKFDRYCKRH